MKISVIVLFIISILMAIDSLTVMAQSSPEEQRARKIVEKIDELFRSNSSYSEMEMNIVTTHWQRSLKMKIWTSGKDKTFIRILEPLKERGMGTLRIKNEMWNYLPKTNKVIKVPPSMMMSSWMGSDFNNDDLVDEFSLEDDYNYTIIHPDNEQEGLIYLQFIPHEGLPIVWGKIISAVRKSDYMPVQDQYFDENGSLMRIMNYKDVKEFDNRKIPSVIELIPQNEEGNKTVLQYLRASFDIKLNEDIFSLRNLRTPEF